MSDWLHAIIFGLVEGLTEFIPVSSTAHLLIAEKLLNHRENDVFNVVIQGGAVLAIIPLFWKKFSSMIFGLREKENLDLFAKLATAFIITSVGMLIAEKRGFKLPEEIQPIAWALIIGGVVILFVETFCKKRALSDRVTWPLAISFGLAQIAAGILTGSSRSGTTIMLAMLLGMARPAATEFTFLLGVPTLLAATGWKLLKALKADGLHADAAMHLAIGFIVAAISSFFVVKWLIRYVQSHTFNGFAIYRILLGGALLIWMTKG